MKPAVILKAEKVKTDWRDTAPSGYFMKLSNSNTRYIYTTLFFKYGEEFEEFPPYCMHIIQPLDDVPFGNFK